MLRFAVGGFLLHTCLLMAQNASKLLDPNYHGWYSYAGDHTVAGRWGVHFDAQWRRADVITRWQQYQLRPGVNFQARRNVLLTLGYVYTRTYPYGEFPVLASLPEHRVYQQALWRHLGHAAGVVQRYRLEQRYIRYPTTPDRSWTYQNRFRYMLRVELPLIQQADGKRLWYVPVSNEVFLGLPPNSGARPFDQNRLFVGVGRSLSAAGSVEVGYLNQFIGQRNGKVFEMNNTLFVAFSSSQPLSAWWRW